MKDARISRRSLLTAGGAAATAYLLGGAKAARAAGNPSLKFVALGDWGTPNSRLQRRVAQAMGHVAGEMDADFVLSLGDNFYPKGVQSVADLHWQETFEDVYTAPSLMKPWHVVLGNHDHEGNTAAQIEYTQRSDRWNLPASFYKRTEMIGGVEADIFFLDTEAIRYWRQGFMRHVNFVPDSQLSWLDAELAQSRARWKIVVGHHPVFSGGSHGPTWPLVDNLKPILERHGVQAYLCGHNHNLEHIVWNNVSYLVSGAGSKPEPVVKQVAGTKFAGAVSGFMAVELDPEEMSVAFYDSRGRTLHRTIIPAQVNAMT